MAIEMLFHMCLPISWTNERCFHVFAIVYFGGLQLNGNKVVRFGTFVIPCCFWLPTGLEKADLLLPRGPKRDDLLTSRSSKS